MTTETWADAARAARGSTADEGGGWLSRPSPLAIVVLLVGLLVMGGLTWATAEIYDHNEDRIVELRVREVGLVLSGAVAGNEARLKSAAELAEATGGDPDKFRAFMAPYLTKGGPYTSASLWSTSSLNRPRAVAGVAPLLVTRPGEARRFFDHAADTRGLSVIAMLDTPSPRLGYAYNARGASGSGGHLVYTENPLPKDRRSRLAQSNNDAFSDLDYAIYLGRTRTPGALLASSLGRVPSGGRQASETLPFGDTTLTLVVMPRGALGGSFFRRLPLIIAAVGVVISIVAALVTNGLVKRRRRAEELASVLDYVAAENHHLYNEQRSIAQKLQHAMVPETLPRLPGIETSSRYVAAASGAEIGGDWYDAVALGDRRLLVIIGDVSGHGLEASTAMAALRYAALAYVAQDPSPASVITRLAEFAEAADDSRFATVLCVVMDLDAGELTVATAGHPAPLLLAGDEAGYVEPAIGPPIGAPRHAPYRETTTAIPEDGGLLVFTDGLVERRGEIIDAGLERLRTTALEHRLALDRLIDSLAADLAVGGHDDDAAMVGVRWHRDPRSDAPA